MGARLAAVKVVHTLAWFSIESCMLYLLYSGSSGAAIGVPPWRERWSQAKSRSSREMASAAR
jgi:hypothetical protein